MQCNQMFDRHLNDKIYVRNSNDESQTDQICFTFERQTSK